MRSKPLIGFLGFFTSVLAVLAGFGLACYLGVGFFLMMMLMMMMKIIHIIKIPNTTINIKIFIIKILIIKILIIEILITEIPIIEILIIKIIIIKILITFPQVEFIALNLAAPFLLLGIGVDDTFVMLSAWRRSPTHATVPER